MQKIRASDISTYLFCERAWWYQRQGIESDNIAELASGTELHQHHGQAVLVSGSLRALAYVLLLIALILLAIHFTNQIL